MAKTRQVRNNTHLLPSLPHAVMKLLEATMDEEMSLSYVAQLAGNDPGLASQILRLANSPLFGATKGITSLSQAAVNLGLVTIQNIAVTLSIHESFSDPSLTGNFSMEQFWWHSLCTAVCSRYLAFQAGIDTPEEAFVAGLLHDLGQLVLIRQDPGHYDAILQAPRTGQTIIKAERRIWGTDHASTGARLLEHWNLQPLLCDAVRYHHHPVSDIETALPIVRLICIADLLSHYFASASEDGWDEIVRVSEGLLSISGDTLDQLKDLVDGEVEKASALLGFKACRPRKEGIATRGLLEEREQRRRLRSKALDLSMLVGSLHALMLAHGEDALMDSFFQGLVVLFDFDKVLITRSTSGTQLHGLRAMGTRHDELVTQIRIPVQPGTIWEKAFTCKMPVHFDAFCEENETRIIDKQIKGFLGRTYLVCPLICQEERLGAVVIGISRQDWEEATESVSVLMLFVRQFANALRGYKYRELWAKEHVINAAILNASPVGFLLSNIQGDIYFINPGGRNILEIDDNGPALPGINIWDYFSLGFDRRDKFLGKLAKGRPAVLSGVEIKGDRTGSRYLDVQMLPVSLSGTDRVLLVIEDVTAAKLLESERREKTKWLEKELARRTKQLKEAQEQIIQAERLGATSTLARQVAHEVNNPRGIIKNFLKVLKIQGASGKVETDTIDKINSEIDRVAGIIRQLSDFSKAQSRTGEGATGLIQKAVTDLEALMAGSLKSKGIVLEVDVPQSLPRVRLSEDALKQILINLVKNAEEALNGQGKCRIRVFQDQQRPEELVIEVADTGPGIPAAVRDKLFDPFTTTKGEGNSGLGLSVCYGLVRAAGGTITLKEREGWGALFEIRLPVAY